MADIQHSSFQHADVHEPRHITLNGTSASGQVITNSASTAQESEYRRLELQDLEQVTEIFSMFERDGSVAQTHYFAAPYTGVIEEWSLVVDNPLVTGSNTWEVRINGVQVTGTPITIAAAGSAGEVAQANASGASSFSKGDTIEVVGTTITNTDATVDTRFVITARRA